MSAGDLLRGLLSLFFPERCPFCDEISVGGEPCESCEKSGLPAGEVRPLPVPLRFGSCQCVTSFLYEGKVREAILRFKFRGRRDYAPALGRALAGTLRQSADLRGAYLVPVPVSKRRLRERGYNQALLLAREAARELGIPCRELLEKTVDNRAQHELQRADRQVNARNVYRVKKGNAIPGAVILIDDVVTTGNTLAECVKTAREAGLEVRCCAALASKRLRRSSGVEKTGKP